MGLKLISNIVHHQPIWAEKRDQLPKLEYVSVYDNYRKFLEAVATWVRMRLNKSGRWTRLARAAIRATQDVFFGIGVYTVNEIFFMAGKCVKTCRFEG